VAVQATPKTNSALQLAQALRMTPQVLGQATNIAKDLGAEAAASTMDVEAAMNDTETKGILGYDKAYQQGLVKRHFVMNEESIKERFLNISRADESLKQTPEEFIATMEGERKAFADELLDQFGGNGNREQAIQALTGTFVDNLRDEATAAWIDNKKDQAFMQLSADASHMLNKSKDDDGNFIPQSLRLTKAMDHARAEMNAWALDLKPSEKAAKLRGIVTADAAVLIEQGKLSQAEALLNEASTYNLHGKAKLFGSAAGKKEITAVRKSIKSARSSLEDSMKDRMDNVERLSDTTFTAMLNPLMGFDAKRKSMLQTLVASNVSEADATAKIDEMFNEGMSSNDMFQAWASLVTEFSINGSDVSQTLLGSIQDDFLRVTKDGLFAKPQLGITTEAQYDEANKTMLEYMLKNPTASLASIPLGANVPKSDTRVQEMFVTNSNAVKWRNDESSQFKFYSDKYTSEITSDKSLGVNFAGEFKSILRQEAQGVWDASGRDMNEFNTLIQAKADEIKADVVKEAKIQKALNRRLKDMVTSATSQSESIRAARRRDDPLGPDGLRDDIYPLLQLNKMPKNQDAFVPALLEERKRMLDDRYASELTKGSLLIFGFPTLESYDEKIRATASIGFQDFALGGEVLDSLSDASEGWDIDNPTPEQQKAIQFWKRQGYRSSSEIDDIIRAQISYTSLTY
jgi:hypothetical protein